MKTYRVRYEIDVQADNEMEAALQVENHMKNGEFRPVLEVRKGKTGKPAIIDLEDQSDDTE